MKSKRKGPNFKGSYEAGYIRAPLEEACLDINENVYVEKAMPFWRNDKNVTQEVVGDNERVQEETHFLDETKTHKFATESQDKENAF